MVDYIEVSSTPAVDIALSLDGNFLLTTGADGILRVYNVSDGSFAYEMQLGTSLGAIDVSPDGRYAVINDTGQNSVYRIDLETFEADAVNYDPNQFYGPSKIFDVACLSTGKTLFTFKGGIVLARFDWETGVFAQLAEAYESAPIASRSADGETVLLAGSGSGPSVIRLFDAVSGYGVGQGFYGFQLGSQAMSDRFIADFTYNDGLQVFTSNLKTKVFATSMFDSNAIIGLVLSDEQNRLFCLNQVDDTIAVFDTRNWQLVNTIEVPFDVNTTSSLFTDFNYDPAGRFFTITSDSGTYFVQNPNAPRIVGTDEWETLSGAMFGDRIDASGGRDTVNGYGGDDILAGGAGSDSIDGGLGNDIISGNGNHDFLIGGEGADIFKFVYATDSTRGLKNADLIMDFDHEQGDRISLSQIDAIRSTNVNEAFRFIEKAAFSGSAGELRYGHSQGNTYIAIDLDGDRVADMKVVLEGTMVLTEADFIL